jgi:HEAT repeat protein
MGKRPGIDEKLARLNSMRTDSASTATGDELSRALKSKSNLLAARAADIIADARIAALEPILVEAFHYFLDNADKGCLAKTAIARALLAIESRAEEVLLLGSRHVQREPAWGGSSDAAVQLRCVCCTALVNMRSRKAMSPLVHLLADADAGARSAAVRAIAGCGGDAAESLLRFKVLVGDADANVIGDCFAGLLGLTRSAGVILPFLDSEDGDLRSAAVLALGESRLPEAVSVLRQRWERQFDADSRGVLALALALTRRPEAIEFLIEQVATTGTRVAVGVVGALAMYRSDGHIRLRMESAARQRGGDILAEFTRRFR